MLTEDLLRSGFGCRARNHQYNRGTLSSTPQSTMKFQQTWLFLVLTIPVRVCGRCTGDSNAFQACPTSVSVNSCHGFSSDFCDDMQTACASACDQVGCSCVWVQDDNSCESDSSTTCHWRGSCVAGSSSPICANISDEDACDATAGCQWKDRGRNPGDPLPRKACTQEIEDLFSCLMSNENPDCISSTGEPEGGFKTCLEVENEYCTNTLVQEHCGACRAKVLDYMSCAYSCPLGCGSETAAGTVRASPPHLRKKV